MEKKEVKILSRERLLDKFFAVDMVKAKLPDGEVDRLIVETKKAAGILLHNVDEGKLILVYQHRIPAMLNDVNGGWVYEIPSGVIDPGEDAEDCVKRESMEEAGYDVSEVEFIAEYLASPGYTTEKISLYYARVQAADRQNDGGGLQDEHELLEVVEVPVEKAFHMVDTNEIKDAKTMLSILWLRNKLKR